MSTKKPKSNEKITNIASEILAKKDDITPKQAKDNIYESEGILKLDNFLDNAQRFWEKCPYFYDKNKIFWIWDSVNLFWSRCDEIELLNKFESCFDLHGMTISTKIKSCYVEALKRHGRIKTPATPKNTLIQFGKHAYDYKTGEKIEVTPTYFFTNPIKWKVGKSTDTPTIDKIFGEWVGEKHIIDLKEVLGLCCISRYELHRFIVLFGRGCNGKGEFLRFLLKFIGDNNKVSSDLKRLMDSRFEASKLFKKLLCVVSEVDYSILKNSSTLKGLTGDDPMTAEFKGKDGFDFVNYATIIMASNSIPATSDKTDGFFRRPYIIDFNNQFSDGKDIVATIPKIEYNNLSKQLLELIPKLIERGKFTNDGDISERRKRYETRSEPVQAFIDINYKKDVNSKTPYWDFYDKFCVYCQDKGIRVMSKKEVSHNLDQLGYERKKQNTQVEDKNTSWWYILGVVENENNTNNTDNTDTSLTPPPLEPEVNKGIIGIIGHKNTSSTYENNSKQQNQQQTLTHKNTKKHHEINISSEIILDFIKQNGDTSIQTIHDRFGVKGVQPFWHVVEHNTAEVKPGVLRCLE